MRAIPILHCKSVERALRHYVRILGFQKKDPYAQNTDWVINLELDGAEIQLSQHAGDGAFGSAVNIRTEGVDSLFHTFLERGLQVTGHEGSPVHNGPVDQTWGIREFYVTDEDGNTLRFGEAIVRSASPVRKRATENQ